MSSAFFSFGSYSSAETIVLVGHSHFIREMLRAQMHSDFAAAQPQLAADLRKKKLSNCGIARLDLEFWDAESSIRSVALLNGTQLV
jgi:hypothetical protein